MIIRSNSNKMHPKPITWNMVFILTLYLLIGCGKPEGQFAFRYAMDDRFKRIDGIPEFKRDQKIEWTFVFKRDYGNRDIGVTVLKKEIIWVEVISRLERIDNLKKIIYGRIEDLSDGTYKLLITEGDKVIAEKEFIIYSDNEEE